MSHYKCPRCGSDEEISVKVETWAHLTEDGTDPGWLANERV